MSEKMAGLAVVFPRFGQTTVYASENGISHMDFHQNGVDVLVPLPKSHPVFLLLQVAIDQLLEYFKGDRKSFDLLIDFEGMSHFQQDVLKITCQIPYGSTRTYGEIARMLGKPSESRAVGIALATNPIPIIIPCHRVVSADGHLRGYSAPGGIETKAWLLQLEGARLIA